jgi:hypothetical protein
VLGASPDSKMADTLLQEEMDCALPQYFQAVHTFTLRFRDISGRGCLNNQESPLHRFPRQLSLFRFSSVTRPMIKYAPFIIVNL